MRLIDPKTFRLELDKLDCIDKFGYVILPITKLNIALERSTVDAVPVVKCGDCKNCSPGLTREERSILDADLVCAYWDSDGLDANDFCSHGERKGGDE